MDEKLIEFITGPVNLHGAFRHSKITYILVSPPVTFIINDNEIFRVFFTINDAYKYAFQFSILRYELLIIVMT